MDHIRVKIIPVAGFGELDIQDAVQRPQQHLRVKIEVESIAEISRCKVGKFRLLSQI